MTINFCEVCLAVIICTIITIVLYIASWYNYEEEKDVRKILFLCIENIENLFQEDEFKKPNTSNMQGLDNDETIPRGEPNEILNFDFDRDVLTSEHQSSGEIIKEKSDLCRLQDEDLRSRVAENESDEHHLSDDYVNIENQNTISEYDSVVHPDTKIGRLHLSIRYDDERSRLIVQILDAQDLIRPEQLYAPEMCLIFTLIGPYSNDDHTRIVVNNTTVIWKEPIIFCSTFENAIKQNLHVNVSNKTDPAAPQDREVRRERKFNN